MRAAGSVREGVEGIIAADSRTGATSDPAVDWSPSATTAFDTDEAERSKRPVGLVPSNVTATTTTTAMSAAMSAYSADVAPRSPDATSHYERA